MTRLIKQFDFRLRKPVLVALVILATLSHTPSVQAAVKYWKSNAPINGNWSDGNNWAANSPNGSDSAGVPGANDEAFIDHTSEPRTVTYDYIGPNVKLESVNINLFGGVSAAGNSLLMSANSLASRSMRIGYGRFGKGTLTQSGGINNTDFLQLGIDDVSIGIYNQSAGSVIVNAGERIGLSGLGLFDQSGGTHTITQGSLVLGSEPGGVGNYTLSGDGSLTANPGLGIGTGTFRQTGGTVMTQGLSVGSGDGSGRYFLSGGTLTARDETIASTFSRGNGSFAQSGGTNNVSNDLRVEGPGVYSLSGGSLNVNHIEYVGSGVGPAYIIQTGGNNTTGDLGVATVADTEGGYILSGDSFLTIIGSASIGSGGMGNFIQAGGTVNIGFDLQILAILAESSGTYTVGGGTTTVGRRISVGVTGHRGGAANLTVNGGVLSAEEIVVGDGPSTSVIINGGAVDGGRIQNYGDIKINKGAITAGNMMLKPTSILSIGLAGTRRHLDHGALTVNGDIALDGSLVIRLNNFIPAPGDSFQILGWQNRTGTFTSLVLPVLTGLMWNASELYTTGTLRILLKGDYNGNGIVDAADYIVWRDTLGFSGIGLAADGNGSGMIDTGDFEVWKAHFGQSGGITSVSNNSIPEPGVVELQVNKRQAEVVERDGWHIGRFSGVQHERGQRFDLRLHRAILDAECEFVTVLR
jgi:hypothetical protein